METAGEEKIIISPPPPKTRGEMEQSPSFSQSFQDFSAAPKGCEQRREAGKPRHPLQPAGQNAPAEIPRHRTEWKAKESLEVTFRVSPSDAATFSAPGRRKGSRRVKGVRRRGRGAARENPRVEETAFPGRRRVGVGPTLNTLPSDAAPLSQGSA